MPKDNRDFFIEKKIWSVVKDELCSCYLDSYFSKILNTGVPILYVDCFAGKGKYEDGKEGSPLIAINCLKNSITNYSANNGPLPSLELKFIELNHAEDLRANLTGQLEGHCEVIKGEFKEKILLLLRDAKRKYSNLNVFLYIDPYGIKDLNMELFDSVSKTFQTAELLINLNSFGFIREACRVMKITFREREAEVFSSLNEYDNSTMNSLSELDAIAGGDYWRNIITSYKDGRTDCYQAEKVFARQYKTRLQEKFKYVLDMPIRLKPGQQPKYRMVHATNHPDGCVLMADNIVKRTDHLVIDIQLGGQLNLFQQTADNEIVDDKVIESKIRKLLPIEYVRLNEFLANFYNEIQVLRNPATTEKGRPRTFWQEGKGNTLKLKKK